MIQYDFKFKNIFNTKYTMCIHFYKQSNYTINISFSLRDFEHCCIKPLKTSVDPLIDPPIDPLWEDVVDF